MKITLRKAVLEDSKMVLDWRNESTTIPWMGTTRSLSFDEHNNWFTNVIFDPNCLFFIIDSIVNYVLTEVVPILLILWLV